MFTLTRVVAALLLMGFSLWIAGPYDLLYDAETELVGLNRLLGIVGFCVGWGFLGRGSRALWLSAYFGVQAVAMVGIIAAVVAAVRDIFVLGYRRQYTDPAEAVLAIPEISINYLTASFELEFLGLLAGGGVVIGLLVHVIDKALDRRRLAR